jgi:hypothetical protein
MRVFFCARDVLSYKIVLSFIFYLPYKIDICVVHHTVLVVATTVVHIAKLQ